MRQGDVSHPPPPPGRASGWSQPTASALRGKVSATHHDRVFSHRCCFRRGKVEVAVVAHGMSKEKGGSGVVLLLRVQPHA